MELRQLQYFVEVARKEHVTQAAEELRVSQSAVSRQIRLLEEELGALLFVQTGRNVHLTPVGELFLARVESVLTKLDRAVEEIHEFLDPDAGEIRMGFPHSLGTYLLPLIVAEFHKDRPKVKFKFKQGRYNNLIRDVRNGEIDLSFISPMPDKIDYITGETLFSEELYAIFPKNHPLAGEEQIRMEQLKEESFVVFREGFSLRTIVMDACLKAGFVPKITFEGEETDTIRGLVAAGLGVSLMPEMALAQTTQLIPAKVKVVEPTVHRTIGLIRRSGEKLPLVAEVFEQYLLQFFKKDLHKPYL